MKGKKAIILAGGDLTPEGEEARRLDRTWDLVVCADSGARHAETLGLTPDVLVGDMDSIDSRLLRSLEAIPRLTFAREKDETDSQIAVNWALQRGADYIVVAGGLGSRFDHSLANAQLLYHIHRAGGQGIITDGRQACHLLTNRLELRGVPGYTLSVLPLVTPCRGLSLKGLRWELDHFDLEVGDTRTISNEFTEDTAALTLQAGAALVVAGPPED